MALTTVLRTNVLHCDIVYVLPVIRSYTQHSQQYKINTVTY